MGNELNMDNYNIKQNDNMKSGLGFGGLRWCVSVEKPFEEHVTVCKLETLL